MKTKMDIKELSEWGKPIGDKLLIAGPCSVESEEQIMHIALELAKYEISLLRGGIWKPRTRPSCFEGVGTTGLKWLKNASRMANLPVTVEVGTPAHVEECLKYGIDAFWIGSRTTPSPFATQAIADSLQGVDIPVMVKNPINPDIGLWIGALERFNKAGIKKLAVVHRGFSTYNEKHYRNKPIWQIPLELRSEIPNIPIICDPSHICGNTQLIFSVAQNAMNLLFDGLMLEVHEEPEKALSDSKQQITPKEYGNILKNLKLRDDMTESEKLQQYYKCLAEEIGEIENNVVELLAE